MMPDKTLWPRVSTCPLQSMETMIDVSSDISQLITSYPIDSRGQISGTAVFQRMDFVPRCPSPRPSSFLKALGLIENLTWTISGAPLPFSKKKKKKSLKRKIHISQPEGLTPTQIKTKPNNTIWERSPLQKSPLPSGVTCHHGNTKVYLRRLQGQRKWKKGRGTNPVRSFWGVFEEFLTGNHVSAFHILIKKVGIFFLNSLHCQRLEEEAKKKKKLPLFEWMSLSWNILYIIEYYIL